MLLKRSVPSLLCSEVPDICEYSVPFRYIRCTIKKSLATFGEKKP